MKCSPVAETASPNPADEKGIPVCRRCGRKLKSPKARELGMGPVCYAKTHRFVTKPLFGKDSHAETAPRV